MIAGIIQAGRSLGMRSGGRVVDGLRAGVDGGTMGTPVSAATTRPGATFGVQAGVSSALQVGCAGAGAAGAGGVDEKLLGGLAGGSYCGGGGATGGAGTGGAAEATGAAVSQVGGAGTLVPKGEGGGRLVE
jgi:hypothetical protein